jgi:hypothetical protein
MSVQKQVFIVFISLIAMGLNGCNGSNAGGFSASSRDVLKAAGDGSGYSGPDLGGTSVPIGADRTFTPDSIKRAINTCSQQAALSVVRQLLREEPVLASGYPVNHASLTSQSWSSRPDNEGYYVVNMGSTLVTAKGCSFDLEYGGCGWDVCMVVDLQQTDCRLPNSSARSLLFAIPGDQFPLVKYKEVLADAVYDEYGNVVSGTKVLQDVRIVTGPLQQAVKMKNHDTNQETDITMNTVEYYNCLLTELQGG